MSMNVFKVGGIILRSPDGFNSFVRIIKNYSTPSFIVISAIDKTSRNLKQCLQLSAEGKFDFAVRALESIIDQHISLAEAVLEVENILMYKMFLSEKFTTIKEILKGISLIKDFSPKIADKVIAEGENLAIKLIYCFIRQRNLSVSILHSEHHIITNTNHGLAIPFKEISIKNIQNSIKKFYTDFYLIQGFTGISTDNKISTMGFESSNLTACLVAAAANTNELIIWTDVNGVSCIDPKFAISPQIEYIYIQHAKVLADEGLKLIYKPMLDYALEFGFDIRIKNAFEPEQSGTLISRKDVITLEQPIIIENPDNEKSKFDFEIRICFIKYSRVIQVIQELLQFGITASKVNFEEPVLRLTFSKVDFDKTIILKTISDILF